MNQWSTRCLKKIMANEDNRWAADDHLWSKWGWNTVKSFFPCAKEGVRCTHFYFFSLCAFFSFPHHNEMLCQKITVPSAKNKMWISPILLQSILRIAVRRNLQFRIIVLKTFASVYIRTSLQSAPSDWHDSAILSIHNDTKTCADMLGGTNIDFWEVN